jgi:hypothetical protein
MKLSLIKDGLNFIISIGVGAIAGNAVNMVKPQNIGAFKKIAVAIGGIALANMIADKTTDYVDQQWEQATEKIKELLDRQPDNKEEADMEMTTAQ